MPKKKIEDIELYYETHGNGYPLIMIMGLSANIDWWNPKFLKAMEKQYKILIFDNRDAGRSDNISQPYRIKDLATDVVKLMNKLTIDKAHILGISMGGMIAQELVLNYPDKVDKLVLASTNCGNPKSVLPSKKVLARLTQNWKGYAEAEIIDEFIPLLYTDEFINNNPQTIEETKNRMLKAPITPEAYQRQINAILQFNTGRRLKEITHPTLVLHGTEDILLPPENGEIIAEEIPNAELKIFENIGHALFSHKNEKVPQAVLKFLRE